MHHGAVEVSHGSDGGGSVSTKLISHKHVKAYALAVAKQRAHQFTRVGGEFFIKVEANVKEFVRHYVRSLPSKGKTIT
jgi:acyl-[acyl carrier protein]--UDP-N-acetylglucosamine O-acyltransferase